MNTIELQSKVTELNRQAKVLNAQRQQSIGKKDALNKQICDMISEYNKTYGTNLTIENIEVELQAVASETMQKATVMEGIINAIQSGDIATANKLAGIETEEEKVAKPNEDFVSQVVEHEVPEIPVQEPVVETPKVEEPVVETPKASEPVIPSPVHNPVNLDKGTVGGSLFTGVEPLPTEGASSVFNRDFSKQEDEDTGIPLAPPPSLGSLL